MIIVGGHDKSVIVFIGRLLTLDIFLWDADCQPYCFALPVDGVAGGIVGAPAGTQTFLVRELL